MCHRRRCVAGISQALSMHSLRGVVIILSVLSLSPCFVAAVQLAEAEEDLINAYADPKLLSRTACPLGGGQVTVKNCIPSEGQTSN